MLEKRLIIYVVTLDVTLGVSLYSGYTAVIKGWDHIVGQVI